MKRHRVTILISGTGRSLANLLSERDAGQLDIDIVRVVSSRPGVLGLEIAEMAGIPTSVVSRKDAGSVDAFSRRMDETVMQDAPSLVVMAGFLSLWRLNDSLRGKVINIHPSLLPLFGGKGYYGHRVHESALAAGVRVSGCTVHFVDDRYDQGPIILQRTCAVLPTDNADTLAARVFGEECCALPEAIRGFLRGHYHFEDGRTVYSGPTDW